MPDKNKNVRDYLVLDFGIWWRHVKTTNANLVKGDDVRSVTNANARHGRLRASMG